MRLKISKKIVATVLILLIILSNISSVFALTVGDTVNLYSKGECPRNIFYTKDNGDTTLIICHYVVYNENGVENPCYCLNDDLPGVDDEFSYSVEAIDMSNIANNQAVWRVLKNAFPYKTSAEMGLANDFDAFTVTKQALYVVLGQKDINRFSAANADGVKMLEALKNLVNIGLNGTETYTTPVISANSQKEASVDNIDSEYISQTFYLDSTVDTETISVILNTLSAPTGTYIADVNNAPKTEFNKGESFKVLVPRVNITEKINVQLTLDGYCKTYPILMGKAPSTDIQDYALTMDPFVISSSTATMTYEPKGETEIVKTSNEYNQYTDLEAGTALEGAVFEIERIDGVKTYKKQFTTNEIGQINEDLELGTYRITELQSPDYYVIDEEHLSYEFTLSHDGQIVSLEFGNDNVNLTVDVEKTGTTETTPGGKIEYDFDIQNKSNVAVSNFIWGDKLPSEIRINTLTTGTFNEDKNYTVQYITNNNSNWKTIAECNTQESTDINFDSTDIELVDGEYVTEVRFVFDGEVMAGFKNTGTKIIATANSDLQENQIIENHTYVTADYLQLELEDEDDSHTIIRTPTTTELSGVLPRTGK